MLEDVMVPWLGWLAHPIRAKTKVNKLTTNKN